MTGLLMLKQLYDLSDEAVVEQWQMNPYYQAFCGEAHFQTTPPVTVRSWSSFVSDWEKKELTDCLLFRSPYMVKPQKNLLFWWIQRFRKKPSHILRTVSWP